MKHQPNTISIHCIVKVIKAQPLFYIQSVDTSFHPADEAFCVVSYIILQIL
jgi:hypothetical protein